MSYLPKGERVGGCIRTEDNRNVFVGTAGGVETPAVIIYVCAKRFKGCPFLGTEWSRKRDGTYDKDFIVYYCVHPAIVDYVVNHPTIKNLMIAKCCSTAPAPVWDRDDETRDPILG